MTQPGGEVAQLGHRCVVAVDPSGHRAELGGARHVAQLVGQFVQRSGQRLGLRGQRGHLAGENAGVGGAALVARGDVPGRAEEHQHQ